MNNLATRNQVVWAFLCLWRLRRWRVLLPQLLFCIDLMRQLEARRHVRRIMRLYKEHFSLLMLVSLSVLTLVGLVALHAAPYLSDVIGALLIGVVVIYYATYFKQYRNLGDAFNQHRQYYFEIYSVWGIIFFNSLFLFVFAFIGAILSSEFPKLGFGGASFYELLIFISQAVVDGATFGLLGSYGINLSDVHMQGFFASTYVYVANFVIDLALLTSLISELREYRGARREMRRLLSADGSLDEDFFSPLTPAKARHVMRMIKERKINDSNLSLQLIRVLSKSQAKEARDILIQVFQHTNDDTVKHYCREYFATTRDRRFRRVCQRMGAL